MPISPVLSADRPETRLATRLSFAVAGFGMACWAPLVPFVKARLGVDFDSSAVLTGEQDLTTVGSRLLAALASTAAGQLTWGETLAYQENLEPWFDGPVF